jgi:hypothetical protein
VQGKHKRILFDGAWYAFLFCASTIGSVHTGHIYAQYATAKQKRTTIITQYTRKRHIEDKINMQPGMLLAAMASLHWYGQQKCIARLLYLFLLPISSCSMPNLLSCA